MILLRWSDFPDAYLTVYGWSILTSYFMSPLSSSPSKTITPLWDTGKCTGDDENRVLTLLCPLLYIWSADWYFLLLIVKLKINFRKEKRSSWTCQMACHTEPSGKTSLQTVWKGSRFLFGRDTPHGFLGAEPTAESIPNSSGAANGCTSLSPTRWIRAWSRKSREKLAASQGDNNRSASR